MMKKMMFFITFLLCSVYLYGQQAQLRGNVINSVTKEPLAGILVTLNSGGVSVTTDSEGNFAFSNIAMGKNTLSLSSSTIVSKEIPIDIVKDTIINLKDIKAIVSNMAANEWGGIVDEAFLDDDSEGTSQEISSLVTLSNDVYVKNAAYQLSQVRFRLRGYNNNYDQKFINGVNFNDQLRGGFNFASIGALNDLTRNGDITNFNNTSTFTYGSIGSSENINMRAGNYARGGKITLSYANRNYYSRAMASYSTGLMDNGWAFTAAVGGRFSDKGYVEGTFYRNLSYALAIEKQSRDGKHSLSFTTFGSPVERGQQGASYQEAYDLVDNNLYNPNWGYQNGKRRNSRVVRAFDPTAILSHIWKINRDMMLTTGLGVHYGRYGSTALNWYGADPRPDYYRNLPSYFESSDEAFELYTKAWQSKDPSITQVNWDALYRANFLSNKVADGAAVNLLEERRSDLYEASLNSVLNAALTNNIKLTVGVGARSTISDQFKTVNDLLGAQYVLDIDKFSERDFPGDFQVKQNDLNNPNRKAIEGDIYGYHFKLNINSANVWIQNQYNTRKIDFFYATKLTYTEFQRDGKMKNGRYPTNSYGKGEKHTFVDYAIRAGLVYKFNGRHFITGNINYATESPLPNNAYISPRISDNAAPDLESGKVASADISYVFSLPSLSGRISAFQTNFYNQLYRVSYYHDLERTFINHVLNGMDKIHRGVEAGVSYRLNESWSFDLAGTVAEYYYSNNPDGTISFENGKADNVHEKVYLKNYYVGGMPQIAGTFGVNYFYRYWFLSINVNGFARNYIDIAPLRRLASNYSTINPDIEADYEAYKILTHQERFNDAYTIDFSVGKVFYLANRRAINFNLAINNLLNKRDIRTGGYEQGRMDITAPRKFASKYYYMQGLNCFLNVSYRF